MDSSNTFFTPAKVMSHFFSTRHVFVESRQKSRPEVAFHPKTPEFVYSMPDSQQGLESDEFLSGFAYANALEDSSPKPIV